jgi:hypothetical protein
LLKDGQDLPFQVVWVYSVQNGKELQLVEVVGACHFFVFIRVIVDARVKLLNVVVDNKSTYLVDFEFAVISEQGLR